MSVSGEIVVEHLRKTFKVAKRKSGMKEALRHLFDRQEEEVEALKDISFTIKKGELVGYIGPNGAGKSTTVKIMSGILSPTSGNCTISGRTPMRSRIEHVKEIGVVFGQRSQLWWDVPVIDSFELLRDIYDIEQGQYEVMKARLTQHLNLEELLHVPVRQLSLGQRMRCELAASLLHQPPILFLDEPTIGLDAVSKLAVRAFIKEINKEFQTTVILTTHDMDDIEALCERVMVIGKGELLFDGNIKALRQLVTHERHLIVDFAKDYQQPLIPNTTLLQEEGKRCVYGFNPEVVKASELIKSVAMDYEIEDVLVENASIETIIAQLYQVLKI